MPCQRIQHGFILQGGRLMCIITESLPLSYVLILGLIPVFIIIAAITFVSQAGRVHRGGDDLHRLDKTLTDLLGCWRVNLLVMLLLLMLLLLLCELAGGEKTLRSGGNA